MRRAKHSRVAPVFRPAVLAASSPAACLCAGQEADGTFSTERSEGPASSQPCQILDGACKKQVLRFAEKDKHGWAASCFVAVAFLLLLMCLPAVAQMGKGPVGVPAQDLPPNLSNVSLEQKLGAQVPLGVTFRDEFGQTVKLGDYFNRGKPVVLSLVYYECPMLCTEVLNGLSSSLRLLKFDLGREYDVVTVSFNPKDTPELAQAKKRAYLQRYGRPEARNGWHFLVGDESNIQALTDSVGFHYQWDEQYQQFVHPAGIMILTPDGRIAQYYYGVEYSPKDMRLGLVQASENRLGSVVDQVLLYCYHYDPRTGKYGAVVSNILKVAGVATVLILGSLLVFLFRYEPRKRAGQV